MVGEQTFTTAEQMLPPPADEAMPVDQARPGIVERFVYGFKRVAAPIAVIVGLNVAGEAAAAPSHSVNEGTKNPFALFSPQTTLRLGTAAIGRDAAPTTTAAIEPPPDNPNYPRSIAAQECFLDAFDASMYPQTRITRKKGSKTLEIRLHVQDQEVNNQQHDEPGTTGCEDPGMDGGRSVDGQTYVQNDKGKMKAVGKPVPIVQDTDAAYDKRVTLPLGNLKRMCTSVTYGPYRKVRRDIQVKLPIRAHYDGEQKKQKKPYTLYGVDLVGYYDLCKSASTTKLHPHSKHRG